MGDQSFIGRLDKVSESIIVDVILGRKFEGIKRRVGVSPACSNGVAEKVPHSRPPNPDSRPFASAGEIRQPPPICASGTAEAVPNSNILTGASR